MKRWGAGESVGAWDEWCRRERRDLRGAAFVPVEQAAVAGIATMTDALVIVRAISSSGQHKCEAACSLTVSAEDVRHAAGGDSANY